ncbi:polymerase [Rochambeau virus]|uniref:RNA-directed RNA polymerase L n=2 Tax=Rochambeau virus TaxID=380435 RepID=A0A0D3R198_9RHAB|nr:polymerase [Rochambeau virus]AJR28499.1 polymerase [Rochambeau virus]
MEPEELDNNWNFDHDPYWENDVDPSSEISANKENAKLLFNQDYNLNSPILNDTRSDFLNILESTWGYSGKIIALNKEEEESLRADLQEILKLEIYTKKEWKELICSNSSESKTVSLCHQLFFLVDRNRKMDNLKSTYKSMLERALKHTLETKEIGETFFRQPFKFPKLEMLTGDDKLLEWGGWFVLLHTFTLAMNCRSEQEFREAIGWNKDIKRWKQVRDQERTIRIIGQNKEHSRPGRFLDEGILLETTSLGPIIMWREFLFLIRDKLLLNKNQVMMYKDTLLARSQSLLSIMIDGGEEGDVRSGTLKRLYKLGDDIITNMGTEGYNLIKLLEPMSVSRIQEISDEIKPLFPPFEDFRNHVEAKSKEFDKDESKWGSRLYSLVRSQISFDILLDIFSAFRHWGHPFIDYKDGLRKLKEQVRLEKDIDEDYAEALASDLAFKILKSKFLEDKIWYVDIEKLDKNNLMYQFVEENTWPNQTIIDKFGDQWHLLPLTRCFEVPELFDPAQIYSDKSHSGTREEVLDYLARDRRGPIRTKKVLKTMLETPERDWKAFFEKIDKEGFPDNSLIIGLKGKERELKIMGRYFALLTWDLRDYFVATEFLIKKFIVPYFGGLTMADDLLGVIKKMLSNAHGQGRPDYDFITVANHIDYEKWNNHQRDESNKSIFRVMDNFLGYNNLISRTHEIFQKSWIYYAGRSDVLERRGNKIVDISPEGCFFWEGQAGGLEGLRQKGWTAVSFLVVERESRKRNTLVKVLAQGDNQIVTTHFKTRKTRTSGELVESLIEIRRNNDILMQSIVNGTNRLGLIINDDETVKSTDFLIYGKVPIIRSQMKGLPIKRWSRVNCVTNDQLPSMGSVLSSATTNALTTCHFSPNPVNSVKNHLFFSNLGIELVCFYNPALGKSMICEENYFKDSILDPLGRIILIYLDPSLGGRCGTNLNRFMIRMFPDPITEGLSFWKDVGERSDKISIRNLAAEIGRPELKRREVKDLEKLIEDPTSLNFKKTPSIQGILKNEVKRSLLRKSYMINNNIMKLSLRFHEEEEERYIRWLLSIRPLFPKFLSECYGASFHGMVKSLIGLFSNSKSIRNVCKEDYRGDLFKIVMNFELDILKSTAELVNRSRRSHGRLWTCSSELADDLRRRSWGEEIVGMTIPHPTELLCLPYRSETCRDCSATEGTVYLTALCPQGIQRGKGAKGPFEPYLGSNTSEGTSVLTPWEKETSIPLIRKAMKLRNCISWFVKEKGNVSNAILNNLRALTGDEWDQDLSGYQRTGSALHRFGCSRVSSGGFCASSPELPSWIVMTSDTLGSLNETNHDFMYQSLFIYFQALLMVDVETSAPGIWHCHIKCRSCIREIPELFLESEYPFEFKDVHHFLEKWVPNMRDTFSEKARTVMVDSRDWDIIHRENKSYYVGKVLGYLYGDKILNKGQSAEESSLYPLSIRLKLNPQKYLLGICDGVLISSSLSILLRRNVIKGKRIDQALMGSSSWVMNELVRQEKFLHFLSGSSVLGYLLRLPHKPIASYPPNGVELGYMFRTQAIKLIESTITQGRKEKKRLNNLESIWIFSDVRDNKIVGSMIIGSLVVMKIVSSSKKRDIGWMKQMQQAYINILDKQKETLLPVVGEMVRSLHIYGTDSEIRHSMKEEPEFEAFEMDYDFGEEEESGYVVSRDLDDILVSGETGETDEIKAPKIQNPLISSLRLAQIATGAHYKLRSILTEKRIEYADFMCLGDGSGGMTSCLLRFNRLSRGLFNSLLDLSSTPLRGMKPGPPSAVLELGSEAKRCVNLNTCWENPNNLCYGVTWRYFEREVQRKALNVTLIVIDAEFRDETMAKNIEENLILFVLRSGKAATIIYKSYFDRLKEKSCELLRRNALFKKVQFCVTEFTSSGSSEVYLVVEYDPGKSIIQRQYTQSTVSASLKKICYCFKTGADEFRRALNLVKTKEMLKGVPLRLVPRGMEELVSIMTFYGVESGHAMKLAGEMRGHGRDKENWLSTIFSLASNKHLNWSHYPSKPTWCSDGEARKILCLYVSALFVQSIWEEKFQLYVLGEEFLRAGGNIRFDGQSIEIKTGRTRHDVKGLYLDDKMALLGGTIRAFFMIFGFEKRSLSPKEHDLKVKDYNSGCRSKIMKSKLKLPHSFWT